MSESTVTTYSALEERILSMVREPVSAEYHEKIVAEFEDRRSALVIRTKVPMETAFAQMAEQSGDRKVFTFDEVAQY